ncbi:hypothetical protein B0H13DRAFT_1880495 [Mycena leptocephala]|nr:hypothetical protein B0H13DRAFT_1880495 [Mycena leptocephala]
MARRLQLQQLILEIPNAWTAGNRPQQWNFPVDSWCKIYAWYRIRHCWPGFYNGRHFTATFTPDGKNVFQYDGMQNEGCATRIPNSRVSSHLVGEIPSQSG